MKYKSLFFGFCLCLCSFLSWGQRVVEVPWYESTNTEMFDIIKIELTEDATILTGQVDYFPDHWFRVVGRTVLRGENGKEYKLLKAEGITLNEKMFLPESGRMTFQLYFESLDDSEKNVDYVEGNHEDDWLIRGIRLSEEQEQKAEMQECVIKGEVIDRPYSHRLALIGYKDDFRIHEPYAIIPVRNGKFEYTCNLEKNKVYELVFTDEMAKSAWRPIEFFVEQGEIKITAYSYDSDENPIVRGGILNEQYWNYCQERDKKFALDDIYRQSRELRDEKRYFSPRAMELQALMERAKNNRQKRDSLYLYYDQLRENKEELTPEANALLAKWELTTTEIRKYDMNYIATSPSLVSYFMLMKEIKNVSDYLVHALPEEAKRFSFVDLQQLEHLYITIYKPMFPEHPYTSSIALMLQSLDRIKVGGNYIDFTAPDLQGNPVRLSEQIDGKVALIDLWASWCGPCRRAAKSMIPVYEKYKSKGFTVVGIAREKAMQTAVAAAAQDGYPWKILVEIGDAGNIWSMYGVGNSGGGTFLVDRDGKILAISPTTEEVEDILKKMLE